MSDAEAPEEEAPRKPLSEAAKRALAEAEERRREAEAEAERAKELGGPKGPEPDPLWRLGEKRHHLRFLRRFLRRFIAAPCVLY
jgi:hypothetical protein